MAVTPPKLWNDRDLSFLDEALNGINIRTIDQFNNDDWYYIYLDFLSVISGEQVKASCYFVDAAFGNNATAQPNNMSFKYKTIIAAVTAAPVGSVVYVFPNAPGVPYAEPNLWKNGVTIIFLPCDVQCSFVENNGGESMRIFGDARFTSNGDFVVVDLSDGDMMFMECDSILAPNGVGLRLRDNKMLLNCNRIIARDNGLQFLTNSAFADMKFYVKEIIQTTNANSMAVQINPDVFSGKIYIETELISGAGTLLPAVQLLGGGGAGSANGLVTINANRIIKTGAAASNIFNCVLQIGMQGCKWIVNANLFSSHANTVGINTFDVQDNLNASEFIFNGDIDVQDSAIILKHPGGGSLTGIYRFNGKFMGIDSTFGVGYEGCVVLNCADGDTLKCFLDGEIQNLMVGGNGIKKSNTIDPDIIIGNLKILTSVASAIVSDTAMDTYKVIHSCARQENNIFMTNSITGSIDYQDLGVE